MLKTKMNRFVQKGIYCFIVASLTLIFTGCGSDGQAVSGVVTQVQMNTYTQGTDQWVSTTISLNTGGFQLAGINLPITDPKDRNKVYGQLSMLPSLCGSNCNGGDLQIALNITQVTKLNGTNATLPNGTALPVGGLQSATVIALPIAETGAQIYFAFGPGIAMLGTAIPFSALDPAGEYIPGINIFYPLHIGTADLIAGIFAGAAPKTTGIGVFLDLAGLMNTSPALNSTIASALGEVGASTTPFKTRLLLKAVKPSSSKENKLYRKIYELSKQGRRLEIR